jgi:hypothetical protein
MLFGFLATNVFYIMWLSNSLGLRVPDEGYSERTWWRLFQKLGVRTKFDIYVSLLKPYLMKAILNVPDEGYSERTWWRLFWTYLMKVILNVPDEDYS